MKRVLLSAVFVLSALVVAPSAAAAGPSTTGASASASTSAAAAALPSAKDLCIFFRPFGVGTVYAWRGPEGGADGNLVWACRVRFTSTHCHRFLVVSTDNGKTFGRIDIGQVPCP